MALDGPSREIEFTPVKEPRRAEPAPIPERVPARPVKEPEREKIPA